ncbi:MAG TPA: ABC transporter permease [Leifsonia sp.]|nr:ABC transporter permease [Leifsonia sp.]
MSRILTGFWGAIVEAWQEVRIHRLRVLLSLIGVAVAVCALTSVVGLGAVAGQAVTEGQERNGGRPALLSMQASSSSQTALDEATVGAAWASVVERYAIRYSSSVLGGQATVQFHDGAVPVGATIVQPAYATMHRVRLDDGSWFDESDAERLAPALVVNTVFWQRMGAPALATHPTVEILGGHPQTGVVIGVLTTSEYETMPQAYLVDSVPARQAMTTDVGAESGGMPMGGGQPPTFEAWVPPELAPKLTERIKSDLTASLGEGAQVSVNRQDYAAQGGDPFLPLQLMVGGVAALILMLGALGLVNIALVTVRQRIREIGIRRSFGATSGRVFFAVMMESVAATVVAGGVGVGAAILIVKSPLVEGFIGQGMVTDFPPFPVDAALIGLGAATLVGALAGLLPALVAVRVKVIDAIRY